MELTVANIVSGIALLTSISATFNAILLRGGKLAWSQILIVLAMIVFMLSALVGRFLPNDPIVSNASIGEILFILGFGLLLIASLKLHTSLK